MKNIFLSTVAIIALIGCGSSGSDEDTNSNLITQEPIASEKQNQKLDQDQDNTENLYNLEEAIQRAQSENNKVGNTDNLFLERDLIEVMFLNEKYLHDQLFEKDKYGNIVNGEYFYEGDIDITKEGENIVFYFIKDSDGTKNGFKKHIFVVKNTPPNIELMGESRIELDIGQIYTLPYVKVSDREDRSLIEDKVEISGIVDIYKPGSYNIKYSVTDRGGLTTEVSREVIVSGKDDMQLSVVQSDIKSDFILLDYLSTKVDHNVEIYNQSEFISSSLRSRTTYGSKIGDDQIILSKKDNVFDLSFLAKDSGDTTNNIKISLSANLGDKLTDSCTLNNHYNSININSKNYNDVIKIVCKNRSEGYYKKDFGLIAENILLPRTGEDLSLDNSDYIGRNLMNIDALYSQKYNLSGKGIKVGIVDGGFVLDTHQELKNRVTIMKKDGQDGEYMSHPTHVAGIIGASGVNSESIGVAVSAELYSLSFLQYNVIYDSPLFDMDKEGIFISNHSYGPETDVVYDILSQKTDQFISYHPDNIAIVSSGNSREGDDYWVIKDFASAKNVITVGAVDKYKNITSFSSTGPINSGRLKPDIVSFGKSVLSSDRGNDKDYVYKSGTSMSAPHITGLVALLEEEYKKVNSELMREDTAKAILVNSSTDLGRIGPDYEYGYGIPDALKAVKIIDGMTRYDSLVKLNDVNEHKERDYSLHLVEDSDVKLTLSWIDPTNEVIDSSDEITPNLNTRLNIKIVDESGKIYYPWSLDDDNPRNIATQDKINSVDNVQQIEAHLKQGNYRVVISNTNMNIGIKQKFALISSVPLGGTALTKEQMSKAEFEYFMMNMF